MAEYFYANNQKQKAKEFFEQIIALESSNPDIRLQAEKRLNRDLSESINFYFHCIIFS